MNKIENRSEFDYINLLIGFYQTFFGLSKVKDREHMDLDYFKTVYTLLIPMINQANQWLKSSESIKNSIVKGLRVALSTAEEIQKDILMGLNGDKQSFGKAIDTAAFFCEGYSDIYKDWRFILYSYENKCTLEKVKDAKRKKKILLAIGVLGFLTFLSLWFTSEELEQLFERKKDPKSDRIEYEILEETIGFDSLLEKKDGLELLLRRKL